MAGIAKHILYSHLRQLEESQLQDFKSLLENRPLEGGRSEYPQSCGKKAEYVKMADRILRGRSEEQAFEMSINFLLRVNRPDLSAQLKQASLEYLDQKELENKAKLGHKKRYVASVMEKIRILQAKNCSSGQSLDLKERYTKLLSVHYYEGTGHEMISTGRKHFSIRSSRVTDSHTEVAKLFEPDERGCRSRIIILQGAPGIGKTTVAMRIMQDWASGELFQDRFDYAFYVPCREIAQLSGQTTLEDHLFQSYLEIFEPVGQFMIDPKKLLFIIDGLDELKFGLREDDGNTPMENKHLNSLRKRLFSNSYTIVTTRQTSLEKLDMFGSPRRFVEILGFSEDDRKEYFSLFFRNEKLAMEALHLAKKSEIFHTMCFVPILCWIFCSVVHQQNEKRENLTSSSGTLTSVYVLFLSSLLKQMKSDLAGLRKLCTLAKEATLEKKVMFDEEDFKKHDFFISDIQSLLLTNSVFIKDDNCQVYSFIHLSLQEFFSALFYFLEDHEDIGSGKPVALPEDVINLLEAYRKEKQMHLELTVHFLFGLLNEGVLGQMEKCLGWKISSEIKPALQRWVIGELERGSGAAQENLMDILYCLHEIHDEDFVRISLQNLRDIDVGGFGKQMNKMDFRIFIFCCKNTDKVHNVRISNYSMELEEFQTLLPWLLTCSSLKLEACSITASFYADICSVLSTNADLTELKLDNNKLGDCGVKQLCEGLKHPDCKLQKLWLSDCSLTDLDCADLSSVLSVNPLLTELSLSNNTLGDSGVRMLCEGLKHPGCRIQKLFLAVCAITGACCADLAAALALGLPLVDLDLCLNKLDDSGVTQLCDGLKHPGSKIQNLWLSYNSFTGSCFVALSSVLSTHAHLTNLDISGNALSDSSLMHLCEGLGHGSCKLEILVLYRCGLTHECCGYLSSALTTNMSLTELHLTGNGIEDSGVQQLCEGLKQPGCRIKKLELDMNGLTDDCIPDLCAALCQSREIQNLCLCWNSFTDQSIGSFIHLMKSCRNLQELRLLGNAFTQEGREELKLIPNIESDWY
ncbi:NACHT, LRR and PYD domains-containing protein 3-like isoform X2 [Ambystoma mexicanum]|uniref:NACHT, LRR and PYD domains-containing protein 3-like isoform X2 n=1 Tax=Ambystoma mexicanum TaxID=8296 RepID=UPI0037E7228B